MAGINAGPIHVDKPSGGAYLEHISGDALELVATFATGNASATSFGLSLRSDGASGGCKVGWSPGTSSIAPAGWKADILPQPQAGTVELHVFLDRSIIETYTGGAALTSRCLGPKGRGVDLWAEGGE